MTANRATAARLAGKPDYEKHYDYKTFVRPFDLEPPDGYASIEEFNADLNERLVERHRLETHPLDHIIRCSDEYRLSGPIRQVTVSPPTSRGVPFPR